MSKEYNLAGKNLLVDGITVLGTRTSAKGSSLANAISTGTAKREAAELKTDTRRFDVTSLQTAVIRDDADKGFQIIVLKSTVVGYEDPLPRIEIETGETYYRICAMEKDPSQETLDSLVVGASINPTPTGDGSWHRGGMLFETGESAMYLLYTGSQYMTVEMLVTAVSDTSVTGTITAILDDTAKGVDDRDMLLVTVYMPFRRAAKMAVYLYNDQTLMDRIELLVTDRTRKWKEIPTVDNKPILDQMTEDQDGLFIDGDCCVVRYEYNDSTEAYDNYQLNTYVYKNDEWVLGSDEDAGQQIQTIYTYMAEAAYYKQSHPEFVCEDTIVGRLGVFGKLKAGILYAAEILANDIRSSNYVESNGTPTRGYKLEYQGGENGNGMIKSVGGIYKDMNVRGSLNLYMNDGTNAGADIEHPTLTTVPASGGDETGSIALPSPAKWGSSDFYNDTTIPANNIVSVTAGTYGSDTITEVARVTNIDANASGPYSRSESQGSATSYGETRSYDVNSAVRGTARITVSGQRGYIAMSPTYYKVSSVRISVNGTLKYSLQPEQQTYPSFSLNYYWEGEVKAGDQVVISMMPYDSMGFISATFNWSVAAVTFRNYGLNEVGFWIRGTNGWESLGADNQFPSSKTLGFTYNNNAYASSIKHSLVDNIVSYSNEYAGDGAFYGKTNDLLPDPTQTYYTDNQGSSPVSGTNVGADFPYQDAGHTTYYYEEYPVEIGRTYRLEEMQAYIDGTLRTLALYSRQANSCTISFKGGGSRTLVEGEYAWIMKSDQTYGLSIRIAQTEAGVEMMGQYPKAHNAYDIGTPSKAWRSGYFMDVLANGSSIVSARDKKENIEPYKGNALELLRKTEIVQYSYKSDQKHLPHIGFIADDTPKELSGVKQDTMSVGDCIGVLIKAVQELEKELDTLKNKEN